MAKNTICLWYDKDAEAAARFYAETFPDTRIETVARAPDDYPAGKKGDALVVEMTILGMPFMLLNVSFYMTPRPPTQDGGSRWRKASASLIDHSTSSLKESAASTLYRAIVWCRLLPCGHTFQVRAGELILG